MMENLIEMDDLGVTIIIGNTHIQKFKEANHQLESHDEVPNVWDDKTHLGGPENSVPRSRIYTT